MQARAIMEEVQGILNETKTSEVNEARDPSVAAFVMLRDHQKLKGMLTSHVDDAVAEWARAFKDVHAAKRYGGEHIAAADLLQSDKGPMKALVKLRSEIDRVISHVQGVARDARRSAGSMGRHEDVDLLDDELGDVDLSEVKMAALRPKTESDDGVDLLADDYTNIGKDAPYIGSENAAQARNLGDSSPKIVAIAKMRVPEKSVVTIKGGVEKSRAAGSQDLSVVGTGKDFVLVSGDPAKLQSFASQIAARSANPTVVKTAFGGGGMAESGAAVVVEFPEDIFDDLTEGDVLRAVFSEASVDEAVSFVTRSPGDSKKPGYQAKKGDPKIIATMRKFAREGSSGKVDGVLVDMSTANLIISIYDKINPKNQAKFAAMPIGRMGQTAWKIASK